MPVPKPRDLLRLSSPDIARLLGRLAAAAPSGHDERRESHRFEFYAPKICMAVEHPGGGTTAYLVLTRNVSAGGIAVLHGGFLHTGSKCKLTLTTRDGEQTLIPASVVRCRHVQGSVHEVGLQFGREIDPSAYLSFDADADAGAETLEPADLRGRVLYVEDSEADCRLLTHHLQSTSIDLKLASRPDEAMRIMGESPFDIILVDLNLHGEDGVELIGRIRESGFRGPVAIVSAETNQTRIDAALQAGAAHHVSKPYRASDLLALLGRLHREIGAALDDLTIYSTLEQQAGMSDLIAAFIEDAHGLAERLKEAIAAENMPAVRELSLNIKGSAQSYGFAHLSNCANEALRSLDETASVAESAVALEKVGLICRSLAVRSKPDREAGADPGPETGTGAEAEQVEAAPGDVAGP